MVTKSEKTKNIKREIVPAAKFKDDIQEYLEALDHFADPELKKLIFERVEAKLEEPVMVQQAVRQYLISKESYFLDKAMKGIENIISNRRYETGVHEDICQGIKTLYAEDSVTEELTEWLTKLTEKSLRYAVICNTKVFFDTIMGIVHQCNIEIPSMYTLLMRIYGSEDKEHLLIEFRRCRPEHEWQIPRCCLQRCFYTEYEDIDYDFGEYVCDDEDSFDDEVESEGEDDSEGIDDINNFDSEYDDEDDYDYDNSDFDYNYNGSRCCDTTVCKIYSKILYFASSICLYKSWVDSSWKDCNGANLGIEIHKKYCDYIEHAFRLLSDTSCQNTDINMGLLQEQYQLFVSTYVSM